MNFTIKPAVRQARKARIALDGPSGSGKTWTALAFGTELGSRMVVIDTERASATLYAGTGQGEFTFDHLDMPSYEPDTLIAALHQCAASGYDVVIIDSLTHFWSGVGGVLEQVDHAAKRKTSGNTFAAWKDVRPMERRLMDAMTSYPGHVIVTMRTKTEWVIVENDRGRKEPKKIGMKPEQREGIEYEFDLVGSLDIEHTFVVTKSRCSVLADAVVPRPDGQVAATLRDWLASGAPGAPAPAMPPPGGWFPDSYRPDGAAVANGNGHASSPPGYPDGTTPVNGNGHAPPRQASPALTGRERARLDWLAWMRSQIAAQAADEALADLWPVVVEAAEQGTIPPADVEIMRTEIRGRHEALAEPADTDTLKSLHTTLTRRGVADRGDRLIAVSRKLGIDLGEDLPIESTRVLTLAQATAVIEAIRAAPEGEDLVTGETVPAGVGVQVPPGDAVPPAGGEQELGPGDPWDWTDPQPGDAGSQWAGPGEVAGG